LDVDKGGNCPGASRVKDTKGLDDQGGRKTKSDDGFSPALHRLVIEKGGAWREKRTTGDLPISVRDERGNEGCFSNKRKKKGEGGATQPAPENA